MNRFFTLALATCLVFFTGCATTSIKVLEKKEPTRPFTKILAIYLDEACDFSLFDATSYNICVRTCFLKEDNLEVRDKVEKMVSSKLSTTNTSIVKSSGLFDVEVNSYDYFRRVVDSLGIDAILMINFRRYSVEKPYGDYTLPASYGGYSGVQHPGSGPYVEPNAEFQCYLISPKSMAFPVWKAALGVKGNKYTGKRRLSQKMVSEMAGSLKSAGYIAH